MKVVALIGLLAMGLVISCAEPENDQLLELDQRRRSAVYIVERVKQRSEAFGNALKALHPGNAYYCGLKDSVKGAYPYIDWVEMTVVDTTHRIGAVYERQRFFLHRADSIWKKHLAEVAANEISWNKMHIVYKNEGDHFLFWFDHDAKDPLRYDTAMGYRGPNVDR